MTKYVTFNPYYSGLSNVIMSYELFLSIAEITKRTAVLPPNTFVLFLSATDNKKDFIDLWTIFDKSSVQKEFDTIDFDAVEEIQAIKHKISSIRSYTGNIKLYLPDTRMVRFTEPSSDIGGKQKRTIDAYHTVLVDTRPESPDFDQFSENRPVIELKCDEKFLHFENNLYGHFWYHVYPGDAQARVQLKNKVNRALRYQPRFYDIATRVLDKIGIYHAVHARRNDFTGPPFERIGHINTPELYSEAINRLLPDDKPLYIATDEKDLSFFDHLRSTRDIYFYQDFEYDLTPVESTVLEQVICAQAEMFYGTYYSTYTKRINVMRGIDNRPAFDNMGINRIVEEQEKVLPLPWIDMPFKKYNWDQSSSYQWNQQG